MLDAAFYVFLKLTMMKFDYDVILQSFEHRYNLIYSDTDILE